MLLFISTELREFELKSTGLFSFLVRFWRSSCYEFISQTMMAGIYIIGHIKNLPQLIHLDQDIFSQQFLP